MNTVTEKGCNDVPHIIMPAEQWPRSRVYYFCSNCRDVCGIPKANPADCPQCGRKGLKEIFSEIAERLEQSWSFFGATRMGKASWLFANEPGGEVHHMDEGAHTFPNRPHYPICQWCTRPDLAPLSPTHRSLYSRTERRRCNASAPAPCPLAPCAARISWVQQMTHSFRRGYSIIAAAP